MYHIYASSCMHHICVDTFIRQHNLLFRRFHCAIIKAHRPGQTSVRSSLCLVRWLGFEGLWAQFAYMTAILVQIRCAPLNKRSWIAIRQHKCSKGQPAGTDVSLLAPLDRRIAAEPCKASFVLML